VLMDPYVSDKLRELEAELSRRASFAGRAPTPVLGPLARTTGRVLRRVGERLESWSSPAISDSGGLRPVAARRAQGSTFRSTEEGC
jgi:hypothetical protein